MAKFIKSRFKVLWGTVFAFFYGFLPNNIQADDHEVDDEVVEGNGEMTDEGSDDPDSKEPPVPIR